MSNVDDQMTRMREFEEAERFVREEFTPVAEKLTEKFMAKAVPLAEEEGWLPDLAQAIGTIGAVSFLGKMMNHEDPEEGFEMAMKDGRREVLRGLFRKEIEDGGDRRAAFLKLLDVVRENGMRAGDGEEGQFPEDWIAAALEAVDAAAEQGLSADEQADAGLASLYDSNRAAMSAAVDEALGYT